MSKIPGGRISKQLFRLNNISNGPGAIQLPREVQSIELKFKYQNSNGHMGAKKFWKENLPRVQFHNPNVPISVVRTYANTEEEEKTTPAVLRIQFGDGKTKQVNCQHKHSTEILQEFIQVVGATELPAEEIPILKRRGIHDAYV